MLVLPAANDRKNGKVRNWMEKQIDCTVDDNVKKDCMIMEKTGKYWCKNATTKWTLPKGNACSTGGSSPRGQHHTSNSIFASFLGRPRRKKLQKGKSQKWERMGQNALGRGRRIANWHFLATRWILLILCWNGVGGAARHHEMDMAMKTWDKDGQVQMPLKHQNRIINPGFSRQMAELGKANIRNWKTALHFAIATFLNKK